MCVVAAVGVAALQEVWLPQFQCLDEKDPPDLGVLGTSPVDD